MISWPSVAATEPGYGPVIAGSNPSRHAPRLGGLPPHPARSDLGARTLTRWGKAERVTGSWMIKPMDEDKFAKVISERIQAEAS